MSLCCGWCCRLPRSLNAQNDITMFLILAVLAVVFVVLAAVAVSMIKVCDLLVLLRPVTLEA